MCIRDSQQIFRDLTLNPSAKAAVKDIQDEKLWKSMYILLRSIFPALRALHYCDASKPSMDKLFFLSLRTTQAIEMWKAFLDDESLFGSIMMDHNLSPEGNMVWGEDDEMGWWTVVMLFFQRKNLIWTWGQRLCLCTLLPMSDDIDDVVMSLCGRQVFIQALFTWAFA